MLQTRLFANTLREAPSEAEVASHRLMLRAGFIRQVAAGVYTYMPLGLRVLRKIESIVRDELDKAGAQELLMPALQPAELWKESGRYEVYGPELIRLMDRHQREFALGPTHEEIITALVKQEINSYRRLPVTLFQIQTKFRDERRPRYGLLRGREFLMKDAYSFDMTWEGLDRTYRSMYDAYHRIFRRCGLEFRAVEAHAGAIGGEGGTHEFMALAEIGEDIIAACTHCDYAANVEVVQSETELLKEGAPCARCADGELKLFKGIEVGHVFKLGKKYSEILGARYLDEKGKEQSMIMGCYGIGVSRLLSTVAEQHHDERGLIWPPSIAPYHVHIVPISVNDDVQMKLAEEIYGRLQEQGIEVLFDDRDERAGVKLNDSDLMGIPYRIVVGKAAVQGQVELVKRIKPNEKVMATKDQVVALVESC